MKSLRKNKKYKLANLSQLENRYKNNPYDEQLVAKLSAAYISNNHYQRLIRMEKSIIKINNITALNNLALAYIKANQVNEAKLIFKHIFSIFPDNITARLNYSTLLINLKQFLLAIEQSKHIIQREPDHIQGLNCLAIAKYHQGMINESISIFNRVLYIEPNNSTANKNIASIYFSIGDYKGSIKHLLNINNLSLNEELLLAKAYHQSGIFSAARKILHKIKNKTVEAHAILGYMNFAEHKIDESIENFTYYLQKSKNSNANILAKLCSAYAYLCYFDKLIEYKALLRDSLSKSVSLPAPFDIYLNIDDPLQQKHLLNQFSKLLENCRQRLYKHDKIESKTKVRIGYISSQFREHAIGFLINDLFNLHDRSKFEVIGILTYLDKDSILQKKICKTFDRVVDVSTLPPEKAAATINAIGLDILVDLNGYMPGECMGILAYQPSPIQCHWIGCNGTTGADFIQYIIMDNNLINHDSQQYYTETLVQLPIYYANYQFDNAVTTKTRYDYNLPTDKFVYCCHLSSYRISETTLNAWIKILKSVVNSVLWITPFYPTAIENILLTCDKYGIPRERIIISEKMIYNQNWAPLLADLWLDSLTYASGVNSILSLWGGLPFLTLQGNSPQQRISANFCHAMHTSELVSNTESEYIQKAIEFGNNPKLIRDIRAKLSKHRETSLLFNRNKFIKYLEQGYIKMIEHYNTQSSSKVITIK